MGINKNVLMLSPGYPAEMHNFTRGLSAVGARVWGVGDAPEESLPKEVRMCLYGYLQVRTLWDDAEVIDAVKRWKGMAVIHRVACLWEPAMLLAARLREALRSPGLSEKQTIPFRDKEIMKQVLDRAGLRTPKHRDASSVSAIWQAATELGYPLIIKPIDGAGSSNTYRIETEVELREVLPLLGHVPRVSVEEFVDGEEYTFDTICIEGRIAYHNIAWYKPRPLVARNHEWVSPQVIALRDVGAAHLAKGTKMGLEVIQALGFKDGFTHMEWYLKPDGEVVFGEIGGRPPGAHQVDQMNFACDIDVYKEWANAICHARFQAKVERKYNVATIYKRAQGQGTISGYEGYNEIMAKYGDHIVWDSLLPVGSRRRNWRATLVSDGFLMLRHPDLQTTLDMADEIAAKLHMFANP